MGSHHVSGFTDFLPKSWLWQQPGRPGHDLRLTSPEEEANFCHGEIKGNSYEKYGNIPEHLRTSQYNWGV
jgi:hypothetical protein